jgi:hypothetical protein
VTDNGRRLPPSSATQRLETELIEVEFDTQELIRLGQVASARMIEGDSCGKPDSTLVQMEDLAQSQTIDDLALMRWPGGRDVAGGNAHDQEPPVDKAIAAEPPLDSRVLDDDEALSRRQEYMHQPTPRGSPDDQFINLSDTDEVVHYCALLGVSSTELRIAVQAAGPEVAKVRRYLNYHRLPGNPG